MENRRCTGTVDADLSDDESDDWQIGKLDLDGEIAKVKVGYTSINGVLACDAGVEDPFGRILRQADTANMATQFIKQGHYGLLMQDSKE